MNWGNLGRPGSDIILSGRHRSYLLTCNRMINRPAMRRREMKNVILLTVLLVFGLTMFSGCASITGRTAGEYIDDVSITTEANAIIVKDPDAHYWKIDVSSTNGNVVLQGFVHNKQAEERLAAKIGQIKGVKSVKSLLKVEEKK
jgi:osmotically-inducible protein OsmY